MAVRLANPLQRIVGVGWGNATTEPVSTGPWWRIVKRIARPDLDVDYVGQQDGTVASLVGPPPKSQFEFDGSEVYTTIEDAAAGLAAIPLDRFARRVYRLDNTNDATTEPPDPLAVPLSDSGWVVQTSGSLIVEREGFLPYYFAYGRVNPFTPDPNCPPTEYLPQQQHATEEHAVNHREWQISLGGSASAGSWTLFVLSSPTDSPGSMGYCIPGT